jgi:P4 family phage/plasmid primase-like protien
MRQDFFTYQPQFKIMIMGNHKPALGHIDEAIRRRFHMIPFTFTIPVAERDKDLPDKLKAEYPAILAWMFDGCAEWMRIGLAPPDKVLTATDSYMADENSISAWMAECCLVGVNYYGTLVDLFPSWKRWAEANGERIGSRKEFIKSLDTRPDLFRKKDRTGRTGWIGLTITPAEPEPRWQHDA